MTKWEFPNQKCAVNKCKKVRKYLAIYDGFILNLCGSHYEDLADAKPIELKNIQMDNCRRIIKE